MTKKYRVLKEGLHYPPDPMISRRLQRGEDIPMHKRLMVTVFAGAVVDDLPSSSIPVLLEKGWIEEVPDASAQ